MEKYVFIYTLEDPISNIVRYIGKTNNLKVRYSTDSFEKYCVKHKKKKVIVQYNLDWEIIREFESITAASEYLKCKPTSISRVLRGERKKFHKTYFKYKDIV